MREFCYQRQFLFVSSSSRNRYTEMRAAAEERGTYMDQLNDQLNSVSVSAQNYLEQARNQAVSTGLVHCVDGCIGIEDCG